MASSTTLKEGYLVKRGHLVHSWKRRYFVLDAGSLRYYREPGGEPKGEISMLHSVTTPCAPSEFQRAAIRVATFDHELVLAADTGCEAELGAWGAALLAAGLATESERAPHAELPPPRARTAAWEAHQRALGRAYEANGQLALALGHYECALAAWDKAHKPVDWAVAAIDVADVLCRQGGAEPVDRAVALYEEALPAFPVTRSPENNAVLQTKLASALRRRLTGSRRANTARAIEAFLQALDVYTPDAFPEQWATVQNNLANAFAEEEPAKACEHYRAAADVYTRDTHPEQWAMTQLNLGTSSAKLGRRDEAVALLNAAMEVFSRDAAPNMWAAVQCGLGDATAAQEAADHYYFALEVFTAEAAPGDHAATAAKLARRLFDSGEPLRALHVTEGAIPVARAHVGALDTLSELFDVAVLSCAALGRDDCVPGLQADKAAALAQRAEAAAAHAAVGAVELSVDPNHQETVMLRSNPLLASH